MQIRNATQTEGSATKSCRVTTSDANVMDAKIWHTSKICNSSNDDALPSNREIRKSLKQEITTNHKNPSKEDDTNDIVMKYFAHAQEVDMCSNHKEMADISDTSMIGAKDVSAGKVH